MKNENTIRITEEHMGGESTRAEAVELVRVLSKNGWDIEYGAPTHYGDNANQIPEDEWNAAIEIAVRNVRNSAEPRMVLWPLVGCNEDGTEKLVMPSEFRADSCLRFLSDGRIESNGGPVGHHEITEDQIDMLPESDQKFVREFLNFAPASRG